MKDVEKMDGLTPRMKAAVANMENDPAELLEILALRARAATFDGNFRALTNFMFKAIKEAKQA